MGFGMDSELAPCELLGFIKTLRPYQALQFNALSLCITKKETLPELPDQSNKNMHLVK